MGTAIVLSGLRTAPALASEDTGVSEWSGGAHARVRLIDADAHGGQRLVGLQIQLDPGYLTYWRSPGEAGLAPTADFAGSENVATATLRYPAPFRFQEAGVEALGYRDQVVFPIDVQAVDPERPVVLKVALSFAVCADLCLPASASLRLPLTGAAPRPEAALVQDAQKLVPVPRPVGAAGSLAIRSIEPMLNREGARILASGPQGDTVRLFAEAPEPWFFRVDEGRPAGNGTTEFAMHVVAGGAGPSTVPVTLTAAGETGAVETLVHLDVRAPTP